MTIYDLLTYSVGTISAITLIGFLGKFTIEKYFTFKEKSYEKKLDLKIKEFETKLSNVLPERIHVIKSVFRLMIYLETSTWTFLNVNSDDKDVIKALNDFKNEFFLNEFYFSPSQRETITKIIKEYTNCWIDFSTHKEYGEWQSLSVEHKKEKAEFSAAARNAFRIEIPKIKEELIKQIQDYYLISV